MTNNDFIKRSVKEVLENVKSKHLSKEEIDALILVFTSDNTWPFVNLILAEIAAHDGTNVVVKSFLDHIASVRGVILHVTSIECEDDRNVH